jgi:glucose/arabinose dehydrogenase
MVAFQPVWVWFVLGLLTIFGPASAGTIKEGFALEKVGDVSSTTTCITFITHERALVCTKSGTVEIFEIPQQGSRLVTSRYFKAPPAEIDASYERGLMDAAIHPDFANNNLLYLYICGKEGFHIVVVIHQENDGGITSRAEWKTKKIIWSDPDGIQGRYHYGGQLSFGPDMNLYLSTGDKSSPRSAQDMLSAAGGVHRIGPDGSIPEDNMGMLDGRNTGMPDSMWATGLRNGWRAQWDLVYGQYYIAEVGGNEQASATEGTCVLSHNSRTCPAIDSVLRCHFEHRCTVCILL